MNSLILKWANWLIYLILIFEMRSLVFWIYFLFVPYLLISQDSLRYNFDQSIGITLSSLVNIVPGVQVSYLSRFHNKYYLQAEAGYLFAIYSRPAHGYKTKLGIKHINFKQPSFAYTASLHYLSKAVWDPIPGFELKGGGRYIEYDPHFRILRTLNGIYFQRGILFRKKRMTLEMGFASGIALLHNRHLNFGKEISPEWNTDLLSNSNEFTTIIPFLTYGHINVSYIIDRSKRRKRKRR